MAIGLGTLIRGVSLALKFVAVSFDKLAGICDSAEITVSWEFGLVLAFLTIQRRWGWIAISITLSFIIAYERGAGRHLSFGWIEAAFDAFGQVDSGIALGFE